MCDQVIPIGLTQIAWEHYLNSVRDITGRSPASGVDACTNKLSDFAKYTASLAEFQAGKETDAKASLRRPGPFLQHSFVSFLILTSNANILRISEGTDLDVLSTKVKRKRAAIVSGRSIDWREAVIVFCTKDTPLSLRKIFNEIKWRFEQLGLQDMWSGYRTDTLQDSTFYLTYNP